jgi:cephalosporin hydroxylase
MFNKKNITKKSDLKNNDSLSSYLKFVAQQNHHAYEAFSLLLKETKPKTIIEIGTSLGGLTQYLKYLINEMGLDTKLITYEINGREHYQRMRESGIDVRLENIFTENYKELKNPEVIDLIQNEGTTIVLCDGGNKVEEFRILSEFLKTGDIIMAHDYAPNKKVFDEEIYMKLWNWFEINDSDILKPSEENNLIDYMKDTFNKAVWTCKIKK